MYLLNTRAEGFSLVNWQHLYTGKPTVLDSICTLYVVETKKYNSSFFHHIMFVQTHNNSFQQNLHQYFDCERKRKRKEKEKKRKTPFQRRTNLKMCFLASRRFWVIWLLCKIGLGWTAADKNSSHSCSAFQMLIGRPVKKFKRDMGQIFFIHSSQEKKRWAVEHKAFFDGDPTPQAKAGVLL